MSVVAGTVLAVNARSNRLLQEIEAGALDSRTPIGDVLRKAVALGRQAGSAELRDWALRELQGYELTDDLPTYRIVSAPLHVDVIGFGGSFVKGQTISPLELPGFAQEQITNDVQLRQGIAEVEQTARRYRDDKGVPMAHVKAADVCAYMNMELRANGVIQHVERLYWSVSPAAMEGVVEHVRTALTVLVTEIMATIPEGTETPPAEVASNALAVAMGGKRNVFNFTSAQAGSTITTSAPEVEKSRWLRTAGAILLGLVAIASLIFTIMQAQNWSF